MGIFISYAVRGCNSQKAALLAVSNLFIAILMRKSWLSIRCSLLLVRFLGHGLLDVNSLQGELANNERKSVATVVLTHHILGFLTSIIIFVHGVDCNCISLGAEAVVKNDHRDQTFLGNARVHPALFWLMIILSCSIVLPWVKLQKVPMRSVVISDHAVQMFVDYGSHPVPGSFQRFSVDPLYK
ncbi:uncharacterized protein EV420DRAFT_1646889 [Desarmillaria tabescens]|uniref:Uncharacterized protein n=1 Tax=Armillaria tabescens TaxID=1929756 RepID=A0AA39JXC7_ARMTA|nr:uncharacterized protein EV420DRAFT_1646889 [Desarmillaria tabescens]KAK0449561.1 hypothetical protein EV420DRAFT_1646889 [Desarmillaria tabescens]